MAIHSLQMGGAEKFFTTLARALAPRHNLICYIPCLPAGDPGMIRRLDGIQTLSIPLFTEFGYKVFYKIRQIIIRRFPSIDIEARLHHWVLRRLRRKWPMDVVNTHLFEATRFCCEAFSDESLPIIESDHGHYYFLQPKDQSLASVIFNRLDGLVCPSQANLAFSQGLPWKSRLQKRVAPYGHERTYPIRSRLEKREFISLGLVARGVVWKGWFEALAAARIARTQVDLPIKLIFVGSGPCLDEIASSLSAEDQSWVHLVGQQECPEALISDFDVGLLPTYLPGESLPNSIIEYLAHHVPVIATAVGGIPEMLSTEEGPAGILIPQGSDGRADVQALADALISLIRQPALRLEFSRRAAIAYRPFALDRCISAYERFFDDLRAAPITDSTAPTLSDSSAGKLV